MKKKKYLAVTVAAVVIGVVAVSAMVTLFSRDKNILLPKLYEGGRISYEKTEERKQELKVATTDLLGLFNPAFSENRGDRIVTSFVFEPFMKKDGLGNYQPCTVREATVSEDGMSMNIVLETGLAFSDGSQVTSFDAAASVIAMALSETEEIREIYDGIKGMEDFRNGKTSFPEGVQLEDETSLTITFSSVSPDNLRILDTLLQKGSFVEQTEEGTPDASGAKELLNGMSRSGMGTGAYQLAETEEPGYVVELFRNEQYRGKKGDIETITVSHTTYSDIAQGLEAEEAGYDIYCWEESAALLSATEQNNGYDIYMKPGNSVYGLFFNEDNSDFADVRLRQAMALVAKENTEKGNLVSEEYSDFMIPAGGFDVYQLCEEGSRQGVRFAVTGQEAFSVPREAKNLIKELTSEGGFRLSYDLPVIEDNEVQTGLAYSLAAALESCGIQINVIPKSQKDYQADCIMGRGYDLLLSSLTLAEDAGDMRELYEMPGSVVRMFRSEKQMQALADYENSYGAEEIKTAKKALFQVLEEEVPFVPLGRKTELIAVSTDLQGFSISEDEELVGNVNQVKVK